MKEEKCINCKLLSGELKVSTNTRHRLMLRMTMTYLTDINNYISNTFEDNKTGDYKYIEREEFVTQYLKSVELLLKAIEMLENRK